MSAGMGEWAPSSPGKDHRGGGCFLGWWNKSVAYFAAANSKLAGLVDSIWSHTTRSLPSNVETKPYRNAGPRTTAFPSIRSLGCASPQFLITNAGLRIGDSELALSDNCSCAGAFDSWRTITYARWVGSYPWLWNPVPRASILGAESHDFASGTKSAADLVV